MVGMVLANYIAYCLLYAAAAFGVAHLLALTITHLTNRNRKPALYIVPPQSTDTDAADADPRAAAYRDFNSELRSLEQNAGIDVRALLRKSAQVDPTPTADTLAAYDAFVKRERRLRAARLRRERVSTIVGAVARRFKRTFTYLKELI